MKTKLPMLYKIIFFPLMIKSYFEHKKLQKEMNNEVKPWNKIKVKTLYGKELEEYNKRMDKEWNYSLDELPKSDEDKTKPCS